MERAGGGTVSGGDAVRSSLDRLLPVLTAGMTPEETEQARRVLAALFALRLARLGPGGLEKETEARLKRAAGLSLEGRRKLLQEDELALAADTLGDRVYTIALGVLRGGVQVTPELKKETRRMLADISRLNAVLVGRYPHLTPVLEEVSDSYLDCMFILGGGKGPLSTRLARAKKEAKPPGKDR